MVIGVVTPYQKPNINYTPLNQRAGRWASIQPIKAPFQDGSQENSKSFGYWFNYLWEEARNADDTSVGDKARLCDAFFAVLELQGQGAVPVAALATMSDEKKRQILTTLLVMGFKRISLAQPMPGTQGVPGSQALDPDKVFKQQIQLNGPGEKTRNLKLGFRADARSYKVLCSQNGFQARARSHGQGVYNDYGMNQPWNPFSHRVYADSMFLRKGVNKDNCLHTVISVGMEFPELLPYPQLSDATLFRLGVKDLKDWTAQDEADAFAHKYQVRAVRLPSTGAPNSGALPPIDHVESNLSIYVLAMDQSRAYSTMAWQQRLGEANAFSEAAVDQVPIDSIVAEVKLVRKHYSEYGLLTFYDFDVKGIQLLPFDGMLQCQYGFDFPERLLQRLTKIVDGSKASWANAKKAYENAKLPKGPLRRGGARVV